MAVVLAERSKVDSDKAQQLSSTNSTTTTPPQPSPSSPLRLLNLSSYEAAAKHMLPPPIYDYYSGGSNDEQTLHYNTRSFAPFVIRPRALIDVSAIDCSTRLSNPDITLSLPLLIAPVAMQCMAHDDGESGAARAAATTGIAMCVSTTATQSIEHIASHSPHHHTPLLFQLYVYNNTTLTTSLVQRAERAGYTALIVTVDAPYLGWKERDIRNDFTAPDRYELANFTGALRSMRKRPLGVVNTAAAAVAEAAADDSDSGSSSASSSVGARSSAFSWSDLRALVRSTRLPVWVKGVLTAEDAVTACESGCTGVIVSNHGGRQLDTTPAPVDCITDIARAVRQWCAAESGGGGGGGRRRVVSVLMDGGVRCGSDVFKALALGADAVLIGRPVIWGLAYAGSTGVQQVIQCLHDELKLCMALAGCRSIADVTRRHVQLHGSLNDTRSRL